MGRERLEEISGKQENRNKVDTGIAFEIKCFSFVSPPLLEGFTYDLIALDRETKHKRSGHKVATRPEATPAFFFVQEPGVTPVAPTISQLIRKGRTKVRFKTGSPALKRFAFEARGLHARLHRDAEKAKLCLA